jgi:hypothetical protein
MLIVSLRRLGSAQKNNLKQFYKLLIFDPRLHLRKTISQLVKGADVVLVELDLSRVFSISRNIIYKWLKQQDIVSVATTFIYESSKYKSLFKENINIVSVATTFIYESSKYKSLFKENINFFIRKLPLLFDRQLEVVIDDQAYLDLETKSVYHPEPEPEEEDSIAVSTGSGTVNSGEIIKRIGVIEKQIDTLIERLKRIEGDPTTQSRAEPIVEKPVARQAKELKVKQGLKKFTVIESVDGDDKIINEFPYRNAIEKRKAKKEAEKCLTTLRAQK